MITAVYRIAKEKAGWRGIDSIESIKRKYSIFQKSFSRCKLFLSEEEKLDLMRRMWNNLPTTGHFCKCNKCNKIHSTLNLSWFKMPDKTDKVLYICRKCMDNASYKRCESCHCYHEVSHMYDEYICKSCFTKSIINDVV